MPIVSEIILAGFSLWKPPDRKGMGKGAEWHNTQFYGLRNTRATRQGRWKPITKDRKNNTPATPTLTQAGANTISSEKVNEVMKSVYWEMGLIPTLSLDFCH